MDFTVQKRIAADILGCSYQRVTFDTARLDEIKEAITKADIRRLINSGAIVQAPVIGISRGRARAHQIKKRQGRYKGKGSRKGLKTARMGKKVVWVARIRLQRSIIKEFRKEKRLDTESYQDLYSKTKGGFFRSKRHLLLYINQNSLLSPSENKTKKADKKQAAKPAAKSSPAKKPTQ